jgi:hypothetical protein
LLLAAIELYYITFHFFRPMEIVRLGEHDLTSQDDGSKPEDFGVEKHFVHEQYKPPVFYHDIALVK